jgi:signal transduction histidine kinase
LLEITEKERRRIGLDLHDDLGQRLSGVALMTKGLQLRLQRRNLPEADDAGRIHDLVHEAMNHASDLAHDLATLDLKEKDLGTAVDELAAHARDMFGIACRTKVIGEIPPLDSSITKQLYKIAQEALTNAIKHGKAKRAAITIENQPAELILTIQNKGLPFPDLEGHSTGMGLRIMNYRSSLIGASLDIKGSASGTTVRCAVPLNDKK